MRFDLFVFFASLAVASVMATAGCSGAPHTGDEAVVTVVATSESVADHEEQTTPSDRSPTSQPSTDRVTVSIRFVEPPSAQTIESLQTLGVVFAERDGELIAVGAVYTASVPEGMIDALEATAEIADIEVSGQRPVILPDAP